MYYFFDFNDSAKQKVEGMIRSLVYQLVSKADKIPDVVAHEYKRQNSERHSAVDSRLAVWVVIFQELLENAHRPFILIDALDECDETEQTLLVSTFQKLLGEKDLLVKWLFTCRPTSLFAGIMAVPGCLHISMQAQVIDKDIHKYLSSRLESAGLIVLPSSNQGPHRQEDISEIRRHVSQREPSIMPCSNPNVQVPLGTVSTGHPPKH
jgi:ankyrin repeat domain-containing protein 50